MLCSFFLAIHSTHIIVFKEKMAIKNVEHINFEVHNKNMKQKTILHINEKVFTKH